MATILITGGTGLVGRVLGQALLQKGYKVIILSRSGSKKTGSTNLSYASWDVAGQSIDKDAIAAADHIVHLAGAGVAEKRWTAKRKQEIVDSRVQSSTLIAESLQQIPNKVRSVISASAIGWYGADPATNSHGDGGVHKFEETDPPSSSFLGQTCRQWEESIEPVTKNSKRLVIFRIGIVLSKEGGVLKEFLKPLKAGVAAILGNGKQMMSWIHIDDLVQLFITAIENEQLNGVYNAVSPNPVSDKELTLALAKSHQKFYIPVHVPAFILKWVLGEMSTEILKSATVSSHKIESAGYIFRYTHIQNALEHI